MISIRLAVLLLCFLLGSRIVAPAATNSPPNILLVLVDDMGYGDPGCYNPESKIATPHINELAKQGMRFTDAHAPGPLCHMSRYGLLTGRFPFRTDVSKWRKHALIEPEQETLATLLKRAGYSTAMVGKWHLGFNEQGYDQPLPGGPIDCGFDTFFGIRASTDIPPYFYISGDRAVAPPTNQIADNHSDGWSPIQGAFWRAGGIAPGLALKDVLPRFTEEAIKVIRSHGEREDSQPMFLYLAYPAPHTPWLPDTAFRGTSGAGMYGDFAAMVDAMLGRVLDSLKKAGMEENTLVVFTSDNGPVWYEDDVERFGHDSSGGLRGMKADAWECGHRMPFIVKWPGAVARNSVSHQLLCFTDLMATFAAITNVKLSPDAGPDSVNLLPVWRGKRDATARQQLLMSTSGGLWAVRRGPWKLITGLGSGGFSTPKRSKPGPGDPAGQLYHLKRDLGETRNLYLREPNMVAELTEQMRQMREQSETITQ